MFFFTLFGILIEGTLKWQLQMPGDFMVRSKVSPNTYDKEVMASSEVSMSVDLCMSVCGRLISVLNLKHDREAAL